MSPHAAVPARRALLALLAGLSLAPLAACTREDAPAARGGPPAQSVSVVTVQPEVLKDVRQLVGELRADESVVLEPEIAGVVESIEFEEGQTVARGDVLFRLREGEQVARLREAEANLALARDQHARTRRLAERNAAAAAQLERAAAELAVARARVELAKVELERTRVRAPFDGVVGARLVSPGERVDTDTELVRVDAVDPLQVVFSVPERVLTLTQPGATGELEVAAYPEERFRATVYFVDPSVDRATRRVLVKGRVSNPDHRLRPGMFAHIRAELGEREALLVPEEAVVLDGAGSFVWRVAEGDLAERVGVRLGVHQGGRVEVVAGLAPGDRVVSAGTHKLYAGSKLRIVPARAEEAGGPGPRAGSVAGGGA